MISTNYWDILALFPYNSIKMIHRRGPKIPILGPQNERKYNLSVIMSQRHPETTINNILIDFYKLLRHSGTLFIQQYQNATQLGPYNSHFGAPRWQKDHFSVIMSQKHSETTINDTLIVFCKLLRHFGTLSIQQY